MAHDPDLDFEPPYASSSTAHIGDQIQLSGLTPSDDEPAPREPADGSCIGEVMHETFGATAAAVQGTRSEPDGADLLCGLVNLPPRDREGRLAPRR